MEDKDLHIYTLSTPLNIAEGTAEPIGVAILTCEIRRYYDLRNLGCSLAYQVMCTSRLVIPNAQSSYAPGAPASAANHVTTNPACSSSYTYPAALTNIVAIQGATNVVVVNYSPRTVNSAVTTSNSSGSASSQIVSNLHSSGSSTSQSNSFGVSASIGFFADALTGGISASYDNSRSRETSREISSGQGFSKNNEQTGVDSMSVKDWACYTFLDDKNTQPTWIWGQEYPWNVIAFCNNNGNADITLPNFVQAQLYDQASDLVLPPSQLSLFGLDFTMKSLSIVMPDSGGDITLAPTIQYCTATHSVSSANAVSASISAADIFTFTTPSINLFLYGLDSISKSGNNATIVGFGPNQFAILPSQASVNSNGAINYPTKFTILSSNNCVLIQDTTNYMNLNTTDDIGAGFQATLTALMANFTTNCESLSITISLKVTDTDTPFSLYMKHWKTGSTGVKLTMLLNKDIGAANPVNPIVKYIDAFEAEGGEGNLLSIALRNLDYNSVDYHDYLQLGLNTIQITATPINGSPLSCGYQIRAISIESN